MDLTENIANNPTVFGKILREEIPCGNGKVYEDDQILAFLDIAPKAKVHVIVIPKKRIKDLRFVEKEDTPLITANQCLCLKNPRFFH